MEISNIGSMQFTDSVTGELSYMVVRVVGNSIALGMAQRTSGEAEIHFEIDKCQLLIDWLNAALVKANNINGQGIEGKEFRGV